MLSPPNSVVFMGCPSAAFVHSYGQILLLRYLMIGLSILDVTHREYSLASTDSLIGFWRSKVKVIVGP